MTLYAVHYAWIDGHAEKAPVGIWAEEGTAHYPPDCEEHRSGGSEARNRPVHFTWSGWIEMRMEWPSTYGASWTSVETDAPMEAALDHIRQEFFAKEHPVQRIYMPDAVPPLADATNESDKNEPAQPLSEPEPAFRHTSAEAWWIVSELIRRHPGYIPLETHPGDGMYDCLELHAVGDDEPTRLRLNLRAPGHVHVFNPPAVQGDHPMFSWQEILGAPNPHEHVRAIERALGIGSPSAPASTGPALAVRFVGTALTMAVNDRVEWRARNAQFDENGGWDDDALRTLAEAVPAAEADLRAASSAGADEPLIHFWKLLRGRDIVAVVSLQGLTYVSGDRRDLLAEYKEGGRRMSAMVASQLAHFLP